MSFDVSEAILFSINFSLFKFTVM